MYDSQSVFAGGAIWSTVAYSFESPLKILLDSPTGFTLEELLDQDELLQELRSMHPQLVQFFSQEHVMAQLVQFLIMEEEEHAFVEEKANVAIESDYPQGEEPKEEKEDAITEHAAIGATTIITTPSVNGTHPSQHWIYSHAINDEQSNSPTIECVDSIDGHQDVPEDELEIEDDDEQRQQQGIEFSKSSSATQQQKEQSQHQQFENQKYIRYPYMACEIICCEIPTILDILVTGNIPSSATTTTTTTTTNTKKKIQYRTTSLLPPPTSILDLLFSMLDSSSSFKDVSLHHHHNNNSNTNSSNHQVHLLDDRRAGYLEKILSILFRERPSFMTMYLNGDHLNTNTTASSSSSPSSMTLGKVSTHHSGGGIPLFQCFFQQLHSYSIMQIVQRLFMPQPFSMTNFTSEVIDDDEEVVEKGKVDEVSGSYKRNSPSKTTTLMGISQQMSKEAFSDDGGTENDQDIISESLDDNNVPPWLHCTWMDSDYLLDLLIDRLFGLSSSTRIKEETEMEHKEYITVEASLHTCDVLINIIQHSTLNAETLKKLTRDPYLGRIIFCACGGSPILCLSKSFSLDNDVCKMDKDLSSIPIPSHFSRHDSIMTASMSVLESLILQLGGYGVVTTPEEIYTMAEKVNESSANRIEEDDSKAFLANTKTMVRYLPLLLRSLSNLLAHPDTDQWETYMQYSHSPQPLLGLSRLRIIRLIESLVLLGQKDIDQLLNTSNCLEICLNYMWKFPWCSMLHQSVANLLVHIFEGEEDRHVLQKYFLYRCNLLRKLMETLSFYDLSRKESISLHHEKIMVETVVVTKPASSGTSSSKIIVVETDGVSNNEIEDETEIHVSDDDVDSAMEQEDQIAIIGGTSESAALDQYPIKDELGNDSSALLLENKAFINGSSNGASMNHAPRLGYVGHIIIICQALMQACNHDFNDPELPGSIAESKDAPFEKAAIQGKVISSSGTEIYENIDVEGSRKRKTRPTTSSFDDNDYSSIDSLPVSLKVMVERHPLYPQWTQFLRKTLAEEVTIQGTTLGGVNSSSPSFTTYDKTLVELEHGSSFMDGDLSYANNDPIELDEHDLDVAASMMEALAIPRSELGEETTKIDLFGHPSIRDSSKTHKQSLDEGEGAPCYMHDDPLGSGRQFEFELDMNEETPFIDEENDPTEEEDAPVMDLYTGYFSSTKPHINNEPGSKPNFNSNNDFDNFSTDWANFDNVFNGGVVSTLPNKDDGATTKQDYFPNDFTSIT